MCVQYILFDSMISRIGAHLFLKLTFLYYSKFNFLRFDYFFLRSLLFSYPLSYARLIPCGGVFYPHCRHSPKTLGKNSQGLRRRWAFAPWELQNTKRGGKYKVPIERSMIRSLPRVPQLLVCVFVCVFFLDIILSNSEHPLTKRNAEKHRVLW